MGWNSPNPQMFFNYSKKGIPDIPDKIPYKLILTKLTPIEKRNGIRIWCLFFLVISAVVCILLIKFLLALVAVILFVILYKRLEVMPKKSG